MSIKKQRGGEIHAPNEKGSKKMKDLNEIRVLGETRSEILDYADMYLNKIRIENPVIFEYREDKYLLAQISGINYDGLYAFAHANNNWDKEYYIGDILGKDVHSHHEFSSVLSDRTELPYQEGEKIAEEIERRLWKSLKA